MKQLILLAMMIAIAVGSVGCVSKTGPTSTQLTSAQYGPYPDAYQTIIKEYHSHTLLDPYSAKYEFATPEKSWMWVKKRTRLGMDYNNSIVIGWGVEYAINAKNRMGGYTGSTRYKAIIVDGIVIYADEMLYQNL